MAHRGRNHILVIFEEVLLLIEAPQRLGQIGSDTGLFGDDEGFGHPEIQVEGLGFALTTRALRSSCRAVV